MSGLTTLIKLQKTRVDEQRQMLARLQSRLEQIDEAITTLEIRQTHEQLVVQEHPEMGMTYGDFVKWAIAQARELEKQRQIANTAVNIARDKLAELFEEQKRYEVAEENRLAAEHLAEQKRETAALDEVGVTNYIRKAKEKK